ncbi:MAG TPA: type VI secretion system baseplate subunit TssE [Pseudomonadota bacterium]|nr:type VI secretion system baseplate subunit TssE [Pseudomonadota bacterium]
MTNGSSIPLRGSLWRRLQDESLDPEATGPGRIDDVQEHHAVAKPYLDLGYVTPAQFRDDLLVDLTHLLRTTRRSTRGWSERYPELRKSIFNFGLPDLNTFGFSGVDRDRLADEIGLAVRTFEPRMLRARVEATEVSAEDSAAIFRIAAQLRIPPRIEQVSLAAMLPVHNKVFQVQDQPQPTTPSSTQSSDED